MKYAERSAVFKGVSDREGPPGPTLQKGAQTATTSKPVLLADRQLQPRDNSGGFALPPTLAKHTIGRTAAQGGVGSMATETGRATSARGTGKPNDQFPQSAKQNAQTPAMTDPGATTAD